MKIKRDNRGLSLIELIIAITIASIILMAITIFISNALKSYRTAHNAIDLQMESHVLMEQIGSWVMEGNRIIVVPQAEVSGTGLASDVLVIYQIPRISDLGHMPSQLGRDSKGKIVPAASAAPPEATKRLIWVQDGGLYTEVVTGILDFDNDTTTSLPSPISPEANCICLYMENFIPQWDEGYNTVKIEVAMKAGTQEYSLNNEFKVRNAIVPTPSPAPGGSPSPGPGGSPSPSPTSPP